MYSFKGKWITSKKLSDLMPIDVFHRQLDSKGIAKSEHLNQHILFRKRFNILNNFAKAYIYISADDYYKLYINGRFVACGPAPAYTFAYNYNIIDISDYLKVGDNIIAVHTLYQGLINRVWQSGDNQHGLILDIVMDDEVIVSSDESFKCCEHSGYNAIGRVGYDTQFLEDYDSGANEVGFEKIEYNDSHWQQSCERKHQSYNLTEQKTKMLDFEEIKPEVVKREGNRIFVDFGGMYVGYLMASANGKKGDRIAIRCSQELECDGTPRFDMRCNCRYEESWILSGEQDTLDWFDYKAFRYAEFLLPEECKVTDIKLISRHYPFELKAKPKAEFLTTDGDKIWRLCTRSLQYGVQEVVQDCMDREKGFYIGDGCYTALTHMVLTGDDSLVRYLIDSAKQASSFNKGLVTCLNCSFMQEIAEFPLILISLMLWHYRLTADSEYLKENYSFTCAILDEYKRLYESDSRLSELDKWCVVEWPANFRDGYDVDITEGKVCHEAHNVINAYYIEAVSVANKMADALGKPIYRDAKELREKYLELFYDSERKLFKDSAASRHSSYISNIFAFSFGLCPEEAMDNILDLIDKKGISSVSLFASFILLEGLIRRGDFDRLKRMILEPGAWKRMLNEGATSTFEGWGKDTKWNTSLFHLTLSYGALFMSNIDLKNLLN